MTQETISRAELDADRARQDTRVTEPTYPGREEFHNAMWWVERRIYLVIALATGLIIGAMQLD